MPLSGSSPQAGSATSAVGRDMPGSRLEGRGTRRMINCIGQGNSRGWSDGFAHNHSNRDYTAYYTPSEHKQQLVPDKDYLSPLTRVSQDTLESLFSSLDENNLPSRWQDFSDLMWKIERHLGIKRAPFKTFLKDRGTADSCKLLRHRRPYAHRYLGAAPVTISALPSAIHRGYRREEVVRHITWFLGAVDNFHFFDLKVYPFADLEGAVAEVKAEGLIKPTGRVYHQDYVLFLRARGGKIAFLREYFDPTRASKALNTPILDLEPW